MTDAVNLLQLYIAFEILCLLYAVSHLVRSIWLDKHLGTLFYALFVLFLLYKWAPFLFNHKF